MTKKKTNNFFIIAIAFILSIAIFFGSCKNRLSLSQVDCIESLNETESILEYTFQSSINQTNIQIK